MRRILTVLVASAAVTGVTLLLVQGARETRAQSVRPNLLLVSIDTLRADHVGCYGYDRPTTPTLDRIAANGTRFARARATAPWTLPSFASMLTGRTPTRHGAGAEGSVRNVAEEVPRVLTPDAPTLAEVLRRAGYRTAAVTANPYLELGPLRGYQQVTNKTVRADRIGAMTRQWIAESALEQPWHLWVHFNDPHEPTVVADVFLEQLGYGPGVREDPRRDSLQRWGSREEGTFLGNVDDVEAAHDLLWTKRALYDAAIRHVDTEIGRILEQLHRQGVLRNTLVVVVSDHGEEFLDHAEAERLLAHDPRGIWGIGHGHSLYEEQLHVPLLMMWEGIAVNRVIEEPLSLVDLMPTLLGFLRVPAPDGMDGVDRRNWMTERDREVPAMVAESLAYGPDWMAWIDGPLKLVTDREGVPQLFFDLEQDPLERVNLLATLPPDSLPPHAVALHDTLMRWSESALEDAPVSTPTAEMSEEMLRGLRSLGYVQ